MSFRSKFVCAAAAAASIASLSGCGSSSGTGPVVTFTEWRVPGTGNVSGSTPGGVWPDDLAGDTSGNIWLAEHHNDEVGRISPDGTYTAYPLPTKGGEADGLAVDSARGYVYCALTSGNKVERISMATGAVTEITMPTAGAVPGDLLLAPDGSLWVSEGYEGGAGSTRIARIDTTTLQVTEYTPQFSRNGTDGMTLLANGDLWFVEYADNAICKFSNGTFTEVVMPRSNVVPTNISSDSKGNLWITEQQGNAIARYTPSTGAWKEITIPTVNAQHSGICVDKSDNIWFTEYNGNKIGLIRAGTLAAADYAIPSPGAGAEDIEVAPNGSIIFTEQNTSKVGKITVPGVSP